MKFFFNDELMITIEQLMADETQCEMVCDDVTHIKKSQVKTKAATCSMMSGIKLVF